MTKKEIIKLLRQVRRDAKAGKIARLNVGICGNAWSLVGGSSWEDQAEFYKRLEDLFKGWPQHSGNLVWPVREVSNSLGDWEGEHLALRLDLLNYVIHKAEGK